MMKVADLLFEGWSVNSFDNYFISVKTSDTAFRFDNNGIAISFDNNDS